MSKLVDLTGQRFGRLSAINRSGSDKWGNAQWLCICDCGNKRIMIPSVLKISKSCGCFRKERMTKHGLCHHPLNSIWRAMKKRCNYKKGASYKYYGGRGIVVCNRWMNSFLNFYNDMKEGYESGLTLERINNDGNYEPGNCTWATRLEQARNTRRNHIIEYDGQKKSISEWANKNNIKSRTLYNRIFVYNWTVEKALTTPTRIRSVHIKLES